MTARNFKDRKGLTPRQYVLKNLTAALTEARESQPCALSEEQSREVLELGLDAIKSDTAVVRLFETAVRAFHRTGRRPSRSFSSHLVIYIDGLTPVAKRRLFAEALREVNVDAAE